MELLLSKLQHLDTQKQGSTKTNEKSNMKGY